MLDFKTLNRLYAQNMSLSLKSINIDFRTNWKWSLTTFYFFNRQVIYDELGSKRILRLLLPKSGICATRLNER